jgi:hypothetical protein
MEDPITADWPSRVPIEEDEEEAESLIEQYAVQPELALDVRSQHRTLGILSREIVPPSCRHGRRACCAGAPRRVSHDSGARL